MENQDPTENEIRVGQKDISAYIGACSHISEDFNKIRVQGLGSQESKAIQVAERFEELSENWNLKGIEPFQVNGVRGLRAILEKKSEVDKP